MYFQPVRRRVRSAGLAEGNTGVSVLGIEVTQAIQDMQNSVTLVANKKTVVRVYLNASSLANTRQITGEIAWQRGNSTENFVPAINPISLQPNRSLTLTEQRHDITTSLNFSLPAEAIGAGSITIRFSRLTVVGGDDIPIIGDAPVTVDFKATPPLLLRVIGLRYHVNTPTGVKAVIPNIIDFGFLRSYLLRAYPVAAITWTFMLVDANFSLPIQNDSNVGITTAEEVNAQLAAMRAREISSGFHPRTHYFGLVHDNNKPSEFFMRGLASGVPSRPRPDTVASGPCGVPNGYSGDFDATYADWYGAHELGHTFGRAHPGFPPAQQAPDDTAFPYPDGQLSTNDNRYVGFDVGDVAFRLPMQALPGKIWHDVMTYGEKEWLSAHTYEAIRVRLLEEEALNLGMPAPAMNVVGTV